MCFEKRDAALAAACKERDDLKKRLAAATEVWGGLKEEMENEISRLKTIAEKQAEMNQKACELALTLDTVAADRDRLQEAYDAMSRDLGRTHAKLTEARNELEKVKTERDALVKIVGESLMACEHCEHADMLVECKYEGECATCKDAKKCACGQCSFGSGFEYIGLGGK